MNSFTYRGICSEDLGLRIESRNADSLPAFSIPMETVPGRDGEFPAAGGRYPNTTVSYTVFFVGRSRDELIQTAARLRSWLCAGRGEYSELTDSYEPDCYRRAAFISKLDVSEVLYRVGRCTITFTCLPYRYALSGRFTTTLTSMGGTLFNKNDCDALPVLKIYGEGRGEVILANKNGLSTWTISNIGGQVKLDSEEMECSRDGVSVNDLLTGDGTFPVLTHGTNAFSFSGDITAVEIIPRWRYL